MDLSPFVTSDPATRRDGWSPQRKVRFLERLAACGNVRAAAARVGMSRDGAYRLRRRDALFARGWATALVLAREVGIDVLADKAIEGIEEEVWYRGEMVGTRRRFDAQLLLAHVARLDRMAEEAKGSPAADAADFDRILACLAEVEVPEELARDEDGVALAREESVVAMVDAMEDALAYLDEERERGLHTEEAYARERDDYAKEAERAPVEVRALWDGWFASACETVDDLLDASGTLPQPGLPANPFAPPPAAAAPPAPDGALPFPRTLSNVSTSALARSLAGPAGGFAAPPRSPFQAPRRA